MASSALWRALPVSALLHLGVAGGFMLAGGGRHRGADAGGEGGGERLDVMVLPAPALPSERPLRGEAAATVLGSADVYSADPKSPWPRADVETPDVTPAARGGGEEGGSETWTGRHDRESWRAQAWNDPFSYRLPRTRTGDERSSPESIPRRPDPGLDSERRDRIRRATAGDRGAPAAPTAGAWDDLDPRYDDGAVQGAGGEAVTRLASTGTATQLAEDGSIIVRAGRPFIAEGELATEADERGPAQDDLDAAQASNERNPGAFEMTQPRAGGAVAGEGVAGPDAGNGLSRRSPREGDGQGGTRADVARGAGHPSMRARAQDDYFKLLYARVLDRVTFPPRLAVTLEQGEVTVAFTLRRDGSVADVRIARSSGFAEFDEAVLRAVRQAAPFGPLPAALAGQRSALHVNAPFSFDNPLIR